jgi:hypothetical protein
MRRLTKITEIVQNFIFRSAPIQQANFLTFLSYRLIGNMSEIRVLRRHRREKGIKYSN